MCHDLIAFEIQVSYLLAPHVFLNIGSTFVSYSRACCLIPGLKIYIQGEIYLKSGGPIEEGYGSHLPPKKELRLLNSNEYYWNNRGIIREP